MNLLKSTYNTVLDALFPIAPAERWIFEAHVESIFSLLPRATASPISEACSIFSYKDEKTWRLVWSIKYKKSHRATALASYALYKMLKIYSTVVTNIIVIPMPISSQRRRERGFNQCELLSNEILQIDSETRNPETKNKLTIINNLLVRKKHTSRQTLKDKVERTESAQDLFAIDQKVLKQTLKATPGIINSTIIIIDDVITTGSTMREAINTLKKAGLNNSWGLSLAH